MKAKINAGQIAAAPQKKQKKVGIEYSRNFCPGCMKVINTKKYASLRECRVCHLRPDVFGKEKINKEK
jgi:NMD protein affecting ribosome stability and mRNA decay